MADRKARRWAGFAAAFALAIVVLFAARLYHSDDAPFTPSSDREVVERIASGAEVAAAPDELRKMESALARSPQDRTLATRVARKYVDVAYATSDSRQLSYAEAALAPWWKMSSPPFDVLVVRALVEEGRHDFVAALVDLDAAVRVAPSDSEAWSLRATVLGTLARYDEARASCTHLHGIASPIFEATCAARLEGIAGGDEARRLLAILASAPGALPADAQRARSVLGEAAWYRGDAVAAERELRAALGADPADVYTRGVLADVLLDNDRAAEVLTLIGDAEPNDALRLRRAIATDRTSALEAKALRDQLRERINELRARGDDSERREEARFVLSVEHDPAAALPIAVANFDRQRDPWDARILLEAAAALADRDPARRAEAVAAAKPALVWVEKTRPAWLPVVRAAATLSSAR